MGGRVEIFQAAFSPCKRCGTTIHFSMRVSGELENSKKPPKFPRYCAECWVIIRAHRRKAGRG